MHTEFWWGGRVGMGDENKLELRKAEYEVEERI
jgi:hypothetical protein